MHILKPQIHRYAAFNRAFEKHHHPRVGGSYFTPRRSNLRSIELDLSILNHIGDCEKKICDTNASPGPQGVKRFDVATFGNLCVDIVLNVPELPPSSPDARLAYAHDLASQSPDKRFWEAGGNCNMAIAASRLGLNCTTIGHVGGEIYGSFLLDVLGEEGIQMSRLISPESAAPSSYETLLCWVLVDPTQRHGFCSVADFSEEPAFSWVTTLTERAKTAIKQSKILFFNGFGFDELPPSVLVSALDYASEVDTMVFFDPGPRAKKLVKGTAEEQRALLHFSKMSDVLLLTSEEAESITGIEHPILAGKELLRNSIRTKWVIVKLGEKGSVLVTHSSVSCVPAFTVNVVDTVGCGDSFVAAIAYGCLNGMSLVHTLAIANAVGAATAMGCGAGRNVASLEKVRHILSASDTREDLEFWTDLLRPICPKDAIHLAGKSLNLMQYDFNFVCLDDVIGELLASLQSL